MDKLSQNIETKPIERKQLIISGTIQGVGFRPFVYRLARRFGLCGYIANRSSDVIIDIESRNGSSDQFVDALCKELPAPANIAKLRIKRLQPAGYKKFVIRSSSVTESVDPTIPPDIKTCDACLREMFTLSNRRYRYPFINCTQCGPRFTITSALPYDRCHTSMQPYTMCPQCQQEYDNPLSRRFHAQPNACAVCGPQLQLLDRRAKKVQCDDIISRVNALLKSGKIVAIRALGGFQLAVDAKNQTALQTLRVRKHRYKKPFAVMLDSIGTIRKFCNVDAAEENLLCSQASPILLVRMHDRHFLADAVSPQDVFCGVMLPYTPLHHLLMQEHEALVMTSGNLTEEPIAIKNPEALERLDTIADYFLLHNREILTRCDDSVIRIVDDNPLFIRRARGYVPLPVALVRTLPEVLAVGADLKNTICVVRNNNAYPGQHVGDLDNPATRSFFRECIAHQKRILRIDPDVIAYDLHPRYYSSEWAMQQKKATLFPVQHHHAHIASCLAENRVDEPVIGFAFDGTGYGTDGAVWGGEALVADCKSFKRLGHLQYVAMPGGDSAAIEAWRMTVAHFALQKNPSVDEKELSRLTGVDELKIKTTWRMVQAGFNCVPTSSMGRLFDAVAALLGLRSVNTYEGEAAIELEKSLYRWLLNVFDSNDLRLPFSIEKEDNQYVIKTEEAMNAMADLAKNRTKPAEIALRFHQSLIAVFTELAVLLRQQYDIDKIALSGGCFQNLYLSKMLSRSLRQHGFDVYTHQKVPPNDGGVSLGQAVVAAMNQCE